MKNLKLAVVAVLTLASSAFAKGAVLSLDGLPPEVKKQVASNIAAAKKSNAKVFRSVQAVRAKAVDIDAKKRGRMAVLSTWLKPLGAPAEWALVEALLVDGTLPDGAKPTAVLAWQVGLVEALGALREPSAQPVLEALLKADVPNDVAQAAATALGNLGNDAAVSALLAAVKSGDAKAQAIEYGMGTCRRLAIAQHLAQALDVADDTRAVVLVRALGMLGNAWAWETPAGAPPAAEKTAIRETIAGALVKKYLASSGNVRQQTQDAVLIVNAPETNLYLDAARAKDVAAVDALKSKLAAHR